MTEEQAKVRWCPMARVVAQHDRDDVSPPANRVHQYTNGKTSDSGVMAGSLCIASACMAWRRYGIGDRQGYCGLAGRPE